MKLGAIILAAGKAERFGGPKQLLEIAGETLLDRACRIAVEAGCSTVLRVLGARADEIMARPVPEGVHTLVHQTWEEGMGGSLAAGAGRLLDIAPDTEALFVLLADQPLVTADLLVGMVPLLTEATIILCGQDRVSGPPALFARQHFEELMALHGDRGAKALAARYPHAVFPFAGVQCDIDTPEAWENFQKSL